MACEAELHGWVSRMAFPILSLVPKYKMRYPWDRSLIDKRYLRQERGRSMISQA